MKSEIEISLKIECLRENLLFIRSKVDEELAKNLRERDIRLLSFLYKEYKIYEFAIQNMEWLFSADEEIHEF